MIQRIAIPVSVVLVLGACGQDEAVTTESPSSGDEVEDLGALVTFDATDDETFGYALTDDGAMVARFDSDTGQWSVLAVPPHLEGPRLVATGDEGPLLTVFGLACADTECESQTPTVAWLDDMDDPEWSSADLPVDSADGSSAVVYPLAETGGQRFFTVNDAGWVLIDGELERVPGLDGVAPRAACTLENAQLIAARSHGDVDTLSVRLARADLNDGAEAEWEEGLDTGPLGDSPGRGRAACSPDSLLLLKPDGIYSYRDSEGPAVPIELPAEYRGLFGTDVMLPDGVAVEHEAGASVLVIRDGRASVVPLHVGEGKPPITRLTLVQGELWLYRADDGVVTFGPVQ